jgi:hypothetical protein
MIKQLSVFVENKAGRLAEVTSLLGEAGINIRGFSVADMADYGIFRLIVSDLQKARQVLKDANFTVTESDLLCLRVPNRPGGLAEVLNVFSHHNVSVEYLYAIANTLIVFSVDNVGEAAKLAADHSIEVLSEEDISRIEAESQS